MLLAALRISAFVALTAASLIQSTRFPTTDGLGCLSASSNTTGAPVVVHNCGTEDPSKHEWDIGTQNASPRPIKIFGDKCLDLIDGIDADGTKLQIWTCVDGNPNQQWLTDLRWAGTEKCIDLTDGNLTDGNQLQIWTCDSTRNNPNQEWAISPPPVPPTIGFELSWRGGALHQAALCISASSNADGVELVFDVCDLPSSTHAGGNMTWDIVPSPGPTVQITTFDGTKCLDVRDGNGTNGNPLQIWSCVEGNTNQLWNMDINGPEISGAKLISWAGTNKCVNSNLEIWDCDSNDRNQWFVAEAVY